MIRLIILLIIVAALSAVGAWFVDNPGLVTLAWQGYEIQTSAGVLFLALLAVTVIATVLIGVVRWVLLTPKRVRAARHDAKKLRWFRALTRGLVAAAAGDSIGARRAARTAEVLLGEPPLTLLLEAQARQLEGDDAGAAAAFKRMLENPETEFLGLRGLMVQATRRGDTDEALALARRAFEINPGAKWVLSNLVELEIAGRDWKRAEKVVTAAIQNKRLTKSEGRRQRGLLLLQQALAEQLEGHVEPALALARKAVDRTPDLIPAAVLAGSLMIETGRHKAARKLLARAWAATPHREIAKAFVKSVDGLPAVERMRAIKTLIAAHPDEADGHVAIAERALDDEDWLLAREHLGAAARAAPTARVCRLMAALEEKENGDLDAARYWLMQATEAPADPTWVCNSCGTPSHQWQLLCAQCRGFDSLEWRAVETSDPGNRSLVVADAPYDEPQAAARTTTEGPVITPPENVVELDQKRA